MEMSVLVQVRLPARRHKRRKEQAVRRLLTFAATVVLAGIALVPAATAEKPIRMFAPTAEPFVLEGPCAFDVRLEVLTNKEVGTAFSDGRFLVTGRTRCDLQTSIPAGARST